MVVRTKKGKNIPIERILLGVIGLAGLLSVIAIAPGVLGALKLFGFNKKYNEKYFTNTLYRMKSKGLIEWVEKKNGKKYIRLTKLGEKKFNHYKLHGQFNPLQKKFQKRFWDGKWRVVIFDIPNAHNKIRDKVRRELSSFGFIKLQGSVWIYPYDCEEFVNMIKADKRIGKQILYIEANKVEYDKAFKSEFGL